MTTVIFLACATTVPSSGDRRGDAFEHDLMIASLEPAFKAKGMELRVVDWQAPLDKFEGADFALLGTAWNYQDNAPEFLDTLEALEDRGVRVLNPPELVRWNIAKTYLRELDEAGVRTIPTLWRESVTAKTVAEALDAFECDRIVVKRQVGAGAEGQELVRRSSLPPADWSFGTPAMLQPFLPAIASEGELSFIFINGAYSHSLVKRAAKGEYRIQSLYGGTEETYQPSADDLAAAQAVLNAVPFDTPLYARIDMLRMDDDGEKGSLALMEAELIEPYLYPVQGPQLGERLAEAIAGKLSA